MSDKYVYPGTLVLVNRLDIRDADVLDSIERRFVTQRMRDAMPYGDFDQAHIQAIHYHLFQDVYEWAGELRQVNIGKDNPQGDTNWFQDYRYLPQGLGYIHAYLSERDFLSGLDPSEFSTEAAKVIGDLNFAHPFREGNGRMQLVFLGQLAEQAGHPIDRSQLDAAVWKTASIESFFGNPAPLIDAIYDARRESEAPELVWERDEPEQEL